MPDDCSFVEHVFVHINHQGSTAMAAESSLRDFRDLKLIGKGSFGRVYRCIRISDGGDYAVKEVAIKAMSQREREDAVNEVRILASVHHQMVIRSWPSPYYLLPFWLLI